MAKEIEEIKKTLNFSFYESDLSFKTRHNIRKYIEEAQDFYNGKQYPDDNEDNMVRVTMNFCSFSSNLKSAKIVGTNRYITFTADNSDYDCHKLQRFDEYNVTKLNEKTEDFQTCLDAFNNGTGLICYVWDKDDTTYKGIYKGGLRLEQIDLLRFAVANPRLKELQNQKWLMYWNDEEVGAVREMVHRKSKKETEEIKKMIMPDNYIEGADKEDISHGLCTVFTRYFRIKGEVCFMCSTREVDLFEYPVFLNPKVNVSIVKYMKKIVDEFRKEGNPDATGKVPDMKIDYENAVEQVFDAEVMNDDEYKKHNEKFYLYPFAKYVPFAINNWFYGRSDIKDLIPIQKGVNFAYSMLLVCVQNNAYNKILAKDGALGGQEITNEAGQVITDYSRMTNGWGIKALESQPLPNGVIDFVDRMFGMARIVYGFNDVLDGSITNKDISGYAVQQMIKQANSSIEQQQQLFWKFCADKASIRLMFYKFYVDKAKYTYEDPDYKVEKDNNARKQLLERQKQLKAQGKTLEVGDVDLTKEAKKVKVKEFNGEEIFGINFDINIDVMQGLADSKLVESQMWDTLIMNGNIQNLEPEMLELYLEANPTVSERTKATLKAVVEKQKQAENYQLKQKLQEAVNYLQKTYQYAKELEAQNNYKTNYLNNLEKEFTNKIGVANKVITAQNKALSDRASEGEVKSNNSRGMGGTHIETQE